MTATPLYSKDALAYFREHYGETEFLVHVVGPDDVLLYSDARDGFDDGGEREGTTPHTLETADAAAAAINATYAYTQAHNPSEFDPFFHATVFHHGRPLAAPEDVPAAPGFLANELAFFAEEYGESEWMVYVHGQDECYDHNEDADEPFTEADVRSLVAKMALWNREHVAEGLAATPVTVFHLGVPFDLNASAVAL